MHLSYFQSQSPKTEYRVIQTHTGPVVILSLFTTFFFLCLFAFLYLWLCFISSFFFSLFKLILCLSVVIFCFAVAFCVRRLDKYLFLCYFSLFLQLCLFIAFLCICFAVFSFLVFPCCDFFVFCVLVFTVIFVSYCRLVFFSLCSNFLYLFVAIFIFCAT